MGMVRYRRMITAPKRRRRKREERKRDVFHPARSWRPVPFWIGGNGLCALARWGCEGTGEEGMVDGSDDVLDLLLVDRPGERSDEEDIQAVLSEERRGLSRLRAPLSTSSCHSRRLSPGTTATMADKGGHGIGERNSRAVGDNGVITVRVGQRCQTFTSV